MPKTTEERLPVKWGADYLRGPSWEPKIMTRAQAQRYADRQIDPALKRAGFVATVSRTDPEMHGGDWYRVNVMKTY